MNNGSINMGEYTVERKAQGKYLKYKLGCIALYALIVFAYISVAVVLGTSSVVISVVTLPFVPLFILLLRHYVWNRYVNVEYKYEILSAYVIFYEVYGKQRQKEVYRRLISEFDLIAPVTEEYRDQYEGAAQIRDFRGSIKSPDAYFMMANDPTGKTVVFFEAAEKTLKGLRYYNSKNLIASRKTTR